MDSQFIWNAILTIGMAVISGFIGLGAKHLKQIQSTLEGRLEIQERSIEQLRDEQKEDLLKLNNEVDDANKNINKFRVEVQKDFVCRSDCIRSTQNLDAKLDRLIKEVTQIKVDIAKIATVQTQMQEVK